MGEMKKFRLEADAEFYAYDIDDALLRLSRYFLDQEINGVDDNWEFIENGDISIHKDEE